MAFGGSCLITSESPSITERRETIIVFQRSHLYVNEALADRCWQGLISLGWSGVQAGLPLSLLRIRQGPGSALLCSCLFLPWTIPDLMGGGAV